MRAGYYALHHIHAPISSGENESRRPDEFAGQTRLLKLDAIMQIQREKTDAGKKMMQEKPQELRSARF